MNNRAAVCEEIDPGGRAVHTSVPGQQQTIFGLVNRRTCGGESLGRDVVELA